MSKYIAARGPRDASIMVVGDHPSVQDEREGMIFSGTVGSVLDQLLNSVGIDPKRVFYTTLSKYRPASNKMRSLLDSVGMPEEILASGLLELKEEIAEVSPNVIIPLGNHALKFLTGKARWNKIKEGKKLYDYTGIGDYRGSILEGTAFTGGAKCVPTYHPRDLLIQYSNKHIVRLDLQRANEQSKFAEIRRPHKLIVIDPQGADRRAWLDWLASPEGTPSPDGAYKADSFMSADIEYIGSRLLCLGATRHADVAVTFKTSGAVEVAEVRDLLLSGVPLCFQNSMFDCSILEWFFNIPCIQFLKHDTMVGMHVAYTEFPKDLGFIGSIFTEQPVWWDKMDSKAWKEVEKGYRTVEEVMEYNAIDVWVTHAAMVSMLKDELADQMLLDEYEYEMSLIKPLWDISKKGVLVDKESMLGLKTHLTEESALLLGVLQHINDGHPINPRSGPQLGKFLFEFLKLPKSKLTATGNASADDSVLGDLLTKCKTPTQKAAVTTVRKLKKNLSLISKFCNIQLDDDGRMRCHYDPAKTVTSRLSSRKFYPTRRGANLQNIPKKDVVRKVFIPDPGYVFGYADLKSAESLVVAHITGDKEMLRLHSDEYMSGKADGHRFVASYLLYDLKRPVEEITREERYIGKQCRHALNYMMSWKRLMDRINKETEETGVAISAAQAKIYREKYLQLHPLLKPWWDEVAYKLHTTHTITTLLGRKRVFYDRPDNCLTDAVAFSPQGTVAKALNIGLIRSCYDEELLDLGYQPLLQVHDAIGFQVPERNADAVSRRLVELMKVEVPISRKNVDPYSITIPVDVKLGGNWGEWSADENPFGLVTWHG